MKLLFRFTGSNQTESFDEPLVETIDQDSSRWRYARVLAGIDPNSDQPTACKRAWKSMKKAMAVVPGGPVEMVNQTVEDPEEDVSLKSSVSQTQIRDVASFYIDRTTVTNADYMAFVKAGGYRVMEYWPQEIWPNVVQFIDQTATPGPRWWRDGQPPRGKSSHPVVGVNWYEASAYARWAGKQLPTPAEWQRAASWHAGQQSKTITLKYPWGDTFEASRANLWAGHHGDTMPVDAFPSGCTPNGIYQLIGNVWEWVDAEYQCSGIQMPEHTPWSEIRGGAFDTYLACQATCQFRSGHSKMWRGKNVGFRCSVPSSDLTHIPGKPAGGNE